MQQQFCATTGRERAAPSPRRGLEPRAQRTAKSRSQSRVGVATARTGSKHDVSTGLCGVIGEVCRAPATCRSRDPTRPRVHHHFAVFWPSRSTVAGHRPRALEPRDKRERALSMTSDGRSVRATAARRVSNGALVSSLRFESEISETPRVPSATRGDASRLADAVGSFLTASHLRRLRRSGAVCWRSGPRCRSRPASRPTSRR